MSLEIPVTARERRARILNRLARTDEPPASALRSEPIVPGEVRFAPATSGQQGLWFIDQLDRRSAQYSVPLALRLTGELSPARLEQAVNEVVERHSSLRTTFTEVDGEPRQTIAAHLPVPLVAVDLTARPGSEEDLDERLRRAVAAQTERGSDLSTGPLIRATLFRLAEREHLLLLTMHHIVVDGWSITVLMHELGELYTALVQDRAPQLAPLGLDFAAYAAWEREWLEGEECRQQKAYWHDALKDAAALVLPTDRPRPAVASVEGAGLEFDLPGAVLADLQRMAAEQGVTTYMILLAAFQTLLAELSGQRDICVVTPMANRRLPAAGDLIGFFTNTVVLRTDLSGDPSFRDVLRRVKEVALGGYQHQGYPFPRLSAELEPAHDRDRSSRFQVMFVLHDSAPERLSWSDLVVEPVEVPDRTSSHDLTLIMTMRADRVAGEFNFRTDLFDPGTIGRLVTRFPALLRRLLAQPETRLSELLETVEGFAADPERAPEQQTDPVRNPWNETTAPEAEFLLPEMFQQQVARTPERVALRSGDEELTYAELNTRANRLAHLLISAGVGPEQFVAVALPRGPDMVVGVLAVLKAGAGYLPIDTGYPAHRIEHMLADAGPVLGLTMREQSSRLPDATPWLLLDSVETASAVAAGSTADPEDADRTGGLHPLHPAYLIYTSGSTGTPKGVVVSHGNVANLLVWLAETVAPDRYARLLFTASLSWDVSVSELFPPLLCGGSVEILPDLLALADRPAGRPDPSWVSGVPSALAQLTAQGALTFATDTVVMGGEELTAATARAVMATLSARELRNLYGPTETTVLSTAWSSVGRIDQAPSIGRPIRNTRVYVLGPDLTPTPGGVAGELYISGAGVTRGYFGRAGLTAGRYLPDPFGPAGARMYRTGDRGRWNAQGELDYLGRVDRQVKVRGFRIELGEIEAVLAECPGLSQGAVLLHQDHSGTANLVAYVVPGPVQNGPTGPTGPEVRAYLATRLPAHGVPSAVVVLDSLPLSANGKLDQAALPAPTFSTDLAPAPRTGQEAVLLELFAGILDLPAVGVDDSFFDLGGHSLLATRLVSRIRAVLKAELELRDLFEAPTVRGMVQRLAGGSPLRPRLRASGRPAELPVSYAQHRLWFIDQLDGTGAVYNITMALRLQGALDREALRAALADVMARHEALRTLYREDAGDLRQVILDEPVARPEFSVVPATEDRLPALTDAEAGRGYDLTVELPLRATLFALSDDEHVLLLVLHHIAADGWSMGILGTDLTRAYAARKAGAEPQWRPLPVQYADHTLWQRRLLGDEKDPDSLAGRQIDYWREGLRALPVELRLPVDRPRPEVASYRGGSVPVHLPAQLHADLRALARAGNGSLFMVLQAGLAALLTRWGAGTDLPIGTPVAGRMDEALDDVVGLFLNTLVLRTDTAGDPSFTELLDRVRETDLAAYAHQDVPFEMLVEVLNPPRSLSRHPLFQIMLVLQNAPEADPVFDGITVAPEPVGSEIAKFDLLLSCAEVFDPAGRPAGLHGELEYSVDLFDRDTVERFGTYLVNLLTAAVADPHLPIGTLPILGDVERELALARAPVPDVVDPTLPELFERQVAATPEHLAVTAGSESLSYAQLNRRANQIARLLRSAGAGPGQLVALALPRDADMVAAVLGVLKTGAGYLPVDPAYPADRITYMLADARPVLGLAVAATVIEPASGSATSWLLLDDPEVAATVAAQPTADLTAADRRLHPLHPAYVIYTSGSTGRPKGVVVAHANIANQMIWAGKHFGTERLSRVLLTTSLSFDVSVFELFAPLLCGGSVEVLTDLLALADRPAGLPDPSWVSGVPSALGQLAAQGPLNFTAGTVVFCGEALSVTVAQQVATAMSARELHNFYGPTETTVYTTCWSAELPLESPPALGDPLRNAVVQILDPRHEPAPRGVAGELYIAGAGVTQGYLERPGLTADRFRPDPHGPPGTRMYNTGDVVRRTAEGELSYLGRGDRQVKVRGFRVELGEVEASIAHHPAVRQAVVLDRSDHAGVTQLVAYPVLVEGATVTPAQLRLHVAADLPTYMVPAAVMIMSGLPLSPNGKLDRSALPEPEFAVSVGQPPRSPQEQVLSELFAAVLDVPRVTIDDNFFDLGGHSLLIFRLVNRIHAALGVRLPVQSLFATPTVRELSETLGRGPQVDLLDPVIRINPGTNGRPIFCLPPITGLSWSYAALLPHLGAEYPIYGLQTSGLVEPAERAGSMTELALEYVRRIRRLQAEGPYRLVGWSLGGIVAQAIATVLSEQGEQVELLALIDSYPFQDQRRFIDEPRTDPEPAALAAISASIGRFGDQDPAVPLLRPAVIEAVAEVLDLEPERAVALVASAVHHFRLADEHVPGRFAGPAVFFAATEGTTPGLTAATWTKYLAGPLEVHPVPGEHYSLMRSPAVAEIGRVLAGALAAGSR
jgi:amino acid adenylation domain-containing protein